jgi:hypothetical protein
VNTRFLQVFLNACVCTALAGCAASGGRTQPSIPAALNVPGTQVLTQTLHATGVQIYQCQAVTGDPEHFTWSFKRPEASLFSKKGKKIGSHYAGPTWEAADGSKVIGDVIARTTSPAPNAIPWLLLAAKTTAGQGIFTTVKSIQRLNTVGGDAPTSCALSELGQELRVSYSADYLFYVAAP